MKVVYYKRGLIQPKRKHSRINQVIELMTVDRWYSLDELASLVDSCPSSTFHTLVNVVGYGVQKGFILKKVEMR